MKAKMRRSRVSARPIDEIITVELHACRPNRAATDTGAHAPVPGLRRQLAYRRGSGRRATPAPAGTGSAASPDSPLPRTEPLGAAAAQPRAPPARLRVGHNAPG